MKTKIRLLAMVLLVLGISACTPRVLTPAQVYANAQEVYLNAWESYHKVFIALPDSAQRGEWVRKYHPKFELAGGALIRYQVTPTLDNKVLLDRALSACEDVLVELMIKRGAK